MFIMIDIDLLQVSHWKFRDREKLNSCYFHKKIKHDLAGYYWLDLIEYFLYKFSLHGLHESHFVDDQLSVIRC